MQLYVYRSLVVLLCSAPLVLAVEEAPEIHTEPRDRTIYFIEGQAVTIPCEATGTPEPMYIWTRNDVALNISSMNGRVVQQAGKGTLAFNSPGKNDVGHYQCFAENHFGRSATAKILLDLAILKSFIPMEKKVHTVTLGDKLTLPCIPPASKPLGSLQWVLVDSDGQTSPVVTDDRVVMDLEGRLRFANVLKSDEQAGKSYSCVMTNDVTHTVVRGQEHAVQVLMKAPEEVPASVMWTMPPDLAVVKGNTLVIGCIFSGLPTPTVEWRKSGGELPTDRVKMSPGGHKLEFRNVDLADAGSYTCYGKNSATVTPPQQEFTIRVSAPPYRAGSIQPQVKQVGEIATFKCAASGQRPLSYSWFINGEPIRDVTDPRIYNNPRVDTSDPETLIIARLTAEDNMVVQCNASNIHGYLWDNVYLRIRANVPPKIYIQPAQNTIVYKPGDMVQIPCVASGVPQPTYKWTKDGDDFHPSDHEARQLPGEGTLVFDEPSEGEGGVYECLAMNSLGVSASDKIFLRPAKIEVFPVFETNKPRYVQEGDALTLACDPPVSYPDPVISWEFYFEHSHWVQVTFDERIAQDPEGRLHFSNIRSTDSSVDYRCVVLNEVLQMTIKGQENTPIVSGSPTVTAPTKLYPSQRDELFLTRDTMKLQCIFAGNPSPNVDWTKSGSVVTSGVQKSDFGRILEIPSVEYSHAGEYGCLGTNSAGAGDWTINVKIESKPSWVFEPTSQTVEAGGEATFHCKAQSTPEPTYTWYINGVPIEEVTDRFQSRLNTMGTSVVLSGLTPADDMTLQCNASNKHGYLWADFYLDVYVSDYRTTTVETSSGTLPKASVYSVFLLPVVPLLLGVLGFEHWFSN